MRSGSGASYFEIWRQKFEIRVLKTCKPASRARHRAIPPAMESPVETDIESGLEPAHPKTYLVPVVFEKDEKPSQPAPGELNVATCSVDL